MNHTAPEKDISIIPLEVIEQRIYLVRGQKVMLDADLAQLYKVSTSALNQAVRRNPDRFPADFMFQMNQAEFADWISQIVISNPRAKMGLRKRPYVFTELGVAMLSSVLNSDRAVRINILIMRTFVKLRDLLANHKHLADKLAALERIQKEQGKTQKEQEQTLGEILVVVDKLLRAQDELPPAIGFSA